MRQKNRILLLTLIITSALFILTACAQRNLVDNSRTESASTLQNNSGNIDWINLETEPDETIEYKTVGDVSLSLHIFYPQNHSNDNKTPAIIFYHGGGWQGGAPSQFYRHSAYLASRGMVAISAEYRVQKRHGTTPAESAKDAKSAMRFVRSHATDFGINPDMLAAGGGSAGGHIAAVAGTIKGFNEDMDDLSISPRPDALVMFNPVYDNSPEGYANSMVKDYWQQISPHHNLDENTPPSVVFFGTADKLISVEIAQKYKATMEKFGVRSDLHLYEGQPHAFFNDARFYETVYESDKFLTSLGYIRGEPTILATKPKPNIVFIAIDDMNDWEGYMGGHPQAQTPHLDKLANEGVAFMNAHSVSPGCSPSRNALLYGIEPYKSGLYAFYEHEIHDELHEKYVSLPRFLKENGYKTYGSGKIHHGPKGNDLEWTDYHERQSMAKTFAEGKGYGKGRKASFRPTTNPLEDHHDYQVASFGIDAINQKHEQPYFAAIGLVKPHLPFDCPEIFYDALPDRILPPAILDNDLNDIGREGNSMRRAKDDKKFKKDKAWEKVRRSYLSCISWVDYNVGRIMDAVEKSPGADNTIVILWSDHGFHLGEKKSFRKFTLWEESSRVPFIIHDMRQKKITKGRKVTQAVTLINVYKTLAEMAQLKTSDYIDGFSLVPQLKNQAKPVPQPAISSWGRGNYSVRTENWRLIQYFDGFQELYDHQQDPNEWHNLAKNPEYKSKLDELANLLPKTEAPTVEKYISAWSIYGADRARLKQALLEQPAIDAKKDKKAKKKLKKKKINWKGY